MAISFEIPKLPEGMTLTCDVYPRGIDSPLQADVALTEETNRKGTYAGELTEEFEGWVTVKIKSGTALIGELTSKIEGTGKQILEELHSLVNVHTEGENIPQANVISHGTSVILGPTVISEDPVILSEGTNVIVVAGR